MLKREMCNWPVDTEPSLVHSNSFQLNIMTRITLVINHQACSATFICSGYKKRLVSRHLNYSNRKGNSEGVKGIRDLLEILCCNL